MVVRLKEVWEKMEVMVLETEEGKGNVVWRVASSPD